jgi:serine incorporator 1/3
MAAALVPAAAMLAPSWIPCMISTSCCISSAACQVCCSIASCFGCKYNAFLSKLTYLFIFFFSACLSIAMRYWGQEWLQSSVSIIASDISPNFCQANQCWGMQAAYRISFAVTLFFAFLAILAFLVPITHLGGWLAKVILYIAILIGCFFIDNTIMLQYADIARGFSVLFLLCQVLIIIEFAYSIHEYIISKMDETDERFKNSGYEPGLLSNCWSVFYVLFSLLLIIGSLSSLGVMFWAFGNTCQLHNFFISETLVIGIACIIISLNNTINKGLLPPSILLAYNTYVCFGALTNNPDGACNPFVNQSSEASIFTGLVITVLSVTWMAYSSAGTLYNAVSSDEKHDTTDTIVSEWPTSTSSKPPSTIEIGNGKSNERESISTSGAVIVAPPSSAASYQQSADEEANLRTTSSSTSQGKPLNGNGNGNGNDDTAASLRASHPWVFGLVMSLAGMYLAMLTTNWGNPSSSNNLSGNPELSLASMWARIGSQFAIHILFLWTMFAPLCFPNREFR